MPYYVAGKLNIEVDDREQLERVIHALGEVQKDIPFEVDRDVRDVADDLVELAQDKILEQPTHGDKHTGLRAEIAKGTKVVKVRKGAVRIITSTDDEDEAPIPRGYDEIAKGWRHPVFGNRNEWVTQRSGTFSWFMESMDDGYEPLLQRHRSMLEDAADRIDMSARA